MCTTVRATLSSVLSGITLMSRPNGSSSSGSRKSLDAGSKESRALARAAFLSQKRESNSAMTQSNEDSMRRLHSLRSSNAVDCAFLRCAGPSTTKFANAADVVVGRTLLTEACSCGIIAVAASHNELASEGMCMVSFRWLNKFEGGLFHVLQ